MSSARQRLDVGGGISTYDDAGGVLLLRMSVVSKELPVRIVMVIVVTDGTHW